MWNAIVVRSLRSLAGIRLGVGIMQGVALCLLYAVLDTGGWPVDTKLAFEPLLLVVTFVPLIVIFGVGNMRHRTLLGWAIVAAVLVAGLALHDATRGAAVGDWFPCDFSACAPALGVWPSPRLLVSTTMLLFIGHSLVVAGDGDRAAVAAYPLYFDAAWKFVAEAGLAAASVVVLWLLLSLAAALFKLMRIEALSELFRARWFAVPLTTLVVAGAIQVTDASAGSVRNIRIKVMIVLSWLLPPMTLFVGGAATLSLTGAAAWWTTRFAIGLLLTAAASLLVLINATHHDGLYEHEPRRVLRQWARVSAVILIPLVAIAAHRLMLRVAQDGWTSNRILAMAGTITVGCYALGYAGAALRRGAWLRYIEHCNVIVALIILIGFFALFTPIADPARLSVLSQVGRLDSGVVRAEKFDFAYLRFEGARYGAAALDKLKEWNQGPNALTIRRRAQQALAMTSPESGQIASPSTIDWAAKITVFPPGRRLPASFLQQDWSRSKSWELPICLVDRSGKCDAFVIDLDHNGQNEVIIDDHTQMIVMAADMRGKWSRVGHLVGPSQCVGVREALRAGNFEVTTPRWSDLKVDGRVLALANRVATGDCP